MSKILLNDYDYNLPKDLIAQRPVRPRDSSRLMVVHKKSIEHLHFRDITRFFRKGDVLVLNNTKVLANKLYGKKLTGAPCDIIIEEKEGDLYRCRVNANKPGIGTVLMFPSGIYAILMSRKDDVFYLRFNKSPKHVLKKHGKLPAPNYVKEKLRRNDHYQTAYADVDGSLAAPTSGLHFTGRLLGELMKKGVKIAPLTLHISFGTFTPIDEDKPVEKHRMDKESYSIPRRTADMINRRKGRLVVCGTTAFKTLESAADNKGIIRAGNGASDKFIYPGHSFRIKPDMMLTNFHFPKSTLLLFVCAYFGRKTVMDSYNKAVKKRYRFYSLGDATLFIR